MKKVNMHLQKLIEKLRQTSAKEGVGLWKRVAADLASPTSARRVVNLSRVNRYAQKDAVVIVPGKVLASGEITQPVTIAAFQFSASAKKKIEAAKGVAMTLDEAMQKHPKGKAVQILG